MYLVASEGDIDIGIHQVLALSCEGLFDIGHDTSVHFWQALCPVDIDAEFGSLSVCRHTLR